MRQTQLGLVDLPLYLDKEKVFYIFLLDIGREVAADSSEQLEYHFVSLAFDPESGRDLLGQVLVLNRQTVTLH